jgi:hypothetical protein
LFVTDKLPFSIRVLLESAVRNCDNFQVRERDVEAILDWEINQAVPEGVEVAFKPARVILQVIVQLMILKYTSQCYKLCFLEPISSYFDYSSMFTLNKHDTFPDKRAFMTHSQIRGRSVNFTVNSANMVLSFWYT